MRGQDLICEAASLQFIKGVDEPTVPEVRLSRSRTGASGAALFVFENPSIFQASGEMGEITGLFMEDDEGTLTTTDVKAKFVNGKPQVRSCACMHAWMLLPGIAAACCCMPVPTPCPAKFMLQRRSRRSTPCAAGLNGTASFASWTAMLRPRAWVSRRARR